LSEQIKFLKENPEFFKGFGKYTEPYNGKLVDKIIEKVRSDKVPLWGLENEIRKYFRKVKVEVSYILPVKYMEDHQIVGGCTEFALLTAAILRKLGYPTAILYAVKVNNVFQDPIKGGGLEGHAVNLVYKDGSWWLLDSTSTIESPTKFIFTRLFYNGYLPGLIMKDPADLGIKNRQDEYFYALYNLENVLLLALQEDIIDPKKLFIQGVYKKRLKSKLNNNLNFYNTIRGY